MRDVDPVVPRDDPLVQGQDRLVAGLDPSDLIQGSEANYEPFSIVVGDIKLVLPCICQPRRLGSSGWRPCPQPP